MPKGYHHVTREIRSQIYALKATGTSLHKISAIVDRHVSTISREIQRNTGGRGYRYKQADEKAVKRRADASRIPQKLTLTLVAIIEEKLPVFTVTYDNGMELAAHQGIAADLNAHCYFAAPYHSWERGLVD